MKQFSTPKLLTPSSFLLRLSFFLALSVGAVKLSRAQITVNQATTSSQVEALVEDVFLGSCVTVSNVNFIGPPSAAGTFNAANSSFTMQNGILLTTGNANTAIGPDNDNDAGVNLGTGGNADLTVLAGETTYDAVTLEFDFYPQDDTLTFRYVFASEEYPEWVNSEYNDVFGFFIAGPDLSGPYTAPTGFPNGSKNIALIPGTSTPVAINNVNNGYSATEPANGPCENCTYYVENSGGTAVQYDGYTTVLTAQVVVQPCQPYHIRLSIADAGDHIYDSGVFLEAGSFTTGGGVSVGFSDAEVSEGCTNEYIVFRRVDVSNNTNSISATYTVGGTATGGVDYSSFPLTVTIPAGQDSVIVPITVPLDFTAEGTETIIISMNQPPCVCLAPGTATINILDNDIPLALTTTGETTICLGQSANLTANVSGSLPPYSGSWNNGAPAGANVSVSPTNTTTYTYTVTDACNSQTLTSTETVTVIRPDFATNDLDQCFDGNSFAFTNTGATGGSVSHYWTFGDGNSSTQENPTHSYGADGAYTVTHHVIFTASACTTSATASITVFPEPTITASTDSDVICVGGTDGAISTTVSGGTAGYNYSWSPGGMTSANVSGLGVGNYSVLVTDANGCTDNASASIIQTDPVPPTITCPATANISTDAGLCTSSASIGTATSSDNCGVQSTVVSNAGPYSVGTTTVTWTATDVNGNTATCTQDVVVTDNENPTVTCPTTANISTDAGLCTSSASIGTATSSDNCGVQSTIVSNAGPYSVGTTTVTWTATDVNGNTATCTQDVVVTDNENPTVTCPATASISTDAGLCTSSASIGTATSSDNCGVQSTIVSNAGPYSVGTTTVTWTATDVNGNTATCTQDVVVTDDENPSVTCPTTANISTDAGLCTSSASIGTATSSDNCGVQSTVVSNAGPYSVGTTTVTWTATDVNGNTATCTQDVVVTDDENPSVNCPTTANISTDAGLCTSSASIGTATSSDNCGVQSTVVSNAGPYSVGTTTVTWTATDVNGNTATCTQDVVVTDDEDPTITCPATANISTDAGLCTSSASIGTATSSDNCGVQSTVVSNAGPYSVGTTTVTWTTTDANGNTATCTQDVVVTDDEVPTISGCPSDIDVTPASSNCSPVVTWNVPQADDNCSATLSSTHNSGDSFPVGTTTVTYTATDALGNQATCSFDVTITPSDLVLSIDPSTVICGANISCNGATDGTATAIVSGGCLPYSYDWSNGQSGQTATGLAAGTYTVIVTDANGSTETGSITLSEPEILEISTYEISEYVGGAGVSCNGASDGEIDITVIGGAECEAYIISWIGPNGFTSSSQNLSGLEAGTYTVTIEDVNGCSTSGSYIISEPDALSPTCTSEDALCNEDANGSVEVSVTGGTEPYAYAWSNGSTDALQSGLFAGTYGVTVTDANGCITTCSSVVSEPDVLVAVVTAYDETLVNGCNGSAVANPTGGTSPYTYEWSDGQTTQTAIDLCAGIYSVTVTDANGCEYTTSVVINPPTCDLDVDVTATDVSCNNGSDGSATATPITVQNNTPFTYVWNNSGTTQTINGITAGPYSVVVTDSIGCEASGSVVVSEPSALTVGTSVVDELTFNGCDGSATANPSGGTSPYTYEWSDGQTTQTASSLCPGTYTVTVTDANGCEETVTITVNPLLCTGFSVAINTERLSCFEAGDGSATAIVTGGTAPFTYGWSNGGTGSSISDLAAGQYTVTVTDAVNCSQTVSGNVTQPALLEAATAVDNVTCHGVANGVVELTVTGGTTPYSFDWSNGATTEDLENLVPGTYNVTITDENGCTTTASGTVTQPDTLGASSVDVQVSCNGGDNGSIDLTPTGGLGPYLYTWNTGAHTQDLNDLSAGTYSVTFADQNGCLYTYETTISEPDALDLTCNSEDALCNGDDNGSVEVSVAGGTAPFLYSWSNGSTDASQNGLGAGTYVVTVTDDNGCVSTCNSVVGEPDVLTAVVVVQDETLVNGCNGYAMANPTGGTPPYSYEWSDGQTTQTAIDLCAGTYTVIVTDANECEFTTSNIVNPPSCDLDVDVTGTDVSCNDGSDGTATATPITVQNNTPFTYVWNNSGTTQTINGITAGPYSVVVTDSIGCEASGSVVISEPTALSVSTVVVDELTFNGCDGSATANPSGGTSPYSYDWSDGQTTQTASNLCPGTYTVTVTDANGCEETVTITVNPLLCTGFSVAINTERLSCFESGDGSATAVVTGGTAPFTYSWSNGGTGSSISDLAAGQYTVTVTDAVNCSQTVSGNVTQPALLEAATAVDNVSCHGIGNGVVELTVTGGTTPYTFNWDNGATTEDLNNVGPGSYNVTITDDNGCTTTASATVSEPDTLQASSVDVNPTCFEGNDGSIDLTVSGGLGPYLVSWDNGSNTADISGLSAGTYTATIVDQNGCIYTYSTTLSEPNLVVPTITADGPTIFCQGDSVTLTSSEASSYLWSPNGETTQSITVYDAGDYSVSVVTEDGCEGTSAATTVTMFQVDPATIIPDDPTEFCDGSSVALSASQGSSYLWSPNGETTQTITVTDSGIYSVTVTDLNGCESSSDDIEITVFDLPEPTVTADGPLTFCDGGSVTLTSSESASYAWAPFGQTTQSIVVTESGIYRVTITNEDGCQSTSDPIQVIVNDNPEPVIVADGPTEFCEGDSVTLATDTFDEYEWNPNGELTQSITISEAGDYWVMVTDTNGCTGSSDTVSVEIFIADSAIITANGPTEICDGGEVTLTASQGSSYLWQPNGETTPSIVVTAPGEYVVEIADANGCISSSDTIVVTVNPNPVPVVSADGPLEFCLGDSVTLTSTAYDGYQWAPNGEMTQSITVTEPGVYRVTVTDENGCQGTSTPVAVTVFDLPEPTITADGPTSFCDGESVTLTASSASAYSWDPNGEQTQSITVMESGVYSVTVTDANGCVGEAESGTEVTVFEIDSAIVTADGPIEFCDGGEVVLTASEGSSYEWSPNGEQTESITVSESGSYEVTITDENGCIASSAIVDVNVLPNPEPTITASGATIFCEGDSVTLTASGASVYLWSPSGQTTQSITVHQAGEYIVQVADANACIGTSDTVEVEVFEPTPTEITASGTTTFCDGNEVTLTATGGQGYTWSPNGEQTQSIVVTESGEYVVTVVDANGCAWDSDTTEVTVFDLPEVTVTIDGPLETCEGDSLLLEATALPQSVTYQWFEEGAAIAGATDPELYVGSTNEYMVTVTDNNGCSASDVAPAIVVSPPPVAVITGDEWTCPEDEVTLVASGGDSYVWNDGSTGSNITVSPDSVSNYWVTASNEFCSITSSDTATVNVYPTPNAVIGTLPNGALEVMVPFNDASGDTSIVSWYWDFGDGEYSEEQDTEHPYGSEGFFTVVLTVANEYGCEDTASIEIEITQIIDIPNVFTPNNDGYNDFLFIDNFGVIDYTLTIYNRWGLVMHHDESGEIFWDGKTPAGIEAEAGTYFYTLKVQNEFSQGDFERTGTITLIR